MEVIAEDGGGGGALQREVGDRRRGRNVLVAINHSPASKHAFDWAVTHLCRLADTLHLIHVLPSHLGMCGASKTSDEEAMLVATQELVDKLAKEAYDTAMVETEVKLAYGDPGKEICAEAGRIDAVAAVMGSRGHSLMKSVLLGSVSEYCSHHCPCPVVIVPPKDNSVLYTT